MTLDFTVLKGDYSIYRFNIDSAIPTWVYESDYYSVTRTQMELSIVCKTHDIDDNSNIKTDKHWRILKINGLLDLSLIGIIANVSNMLKEKNIPIFVISTYNTDYILVKNQNIDKTLIVLQNNGHKVFIEN